MSEQIIISDAGNENLIADIERTGEVYAYDESIAMVDWKRDKNTIPDVTRPAWEVYMDGTSATGRLVHSTGVDDSSRYILNGKLTLEIGEPGSFSFTISPHHYLYNECIPYKTTVTVYQEGVELFRGRVTGHTTDINRQRQIECEGDLAYLNGVSFPDTEIDTKNRTLADAFSYLISLYNKFGQYKAGDARYLAPGDVTLSKSNYNVKMKEWIDTDDTDTATYTNARTLIDDFIETFGGYLRTKRYSDGLVHVEYIAGYTDVNEQSLVYGENMSELSIDSRLDDLFTVLVPTGENKDGSSSKATTISGAKSVTDSSVPGATIKHVKGSGYQNMELIWVEGVELYGRITKMESFDGITKASELLSRSTAYFRECIAGYLGNYSVTAIDRHWLDPSIKPIYLGQKVRIISAPHGIDTKDQMLTCMKIEYDLSAPESTAYEFDIPFQPLTGTFTSKYKKQRKQQAKKTKEASKKAGGARKKADEADKKAGQAGTLAEEAKNKAAEAASGLVNWLKDTFNPFKKSTEDDIKEAKNNANTAKSDAKTAKDTANNATEAVNKLREDFNKYKRDHP